MNKIDGDGPSGHEDAGTLENEFRYNNGDEAIRIARNGGFFTAC